MLRGDRMKRQTGAMLVAASAVLVVTSCTSEIPAKKPLATPSPSLDQTFDCTAAIGTASTLSEAAPNPIAVDVMAITGGAPGSPTDPIQLGANTGDDGFRFAKVGIAIKTGEQFTIAVPQTWQNRMRIGWGNHGEVLATTLHVPGCSSTPPGAAWVIYPGGFRLKAAACVPLTIQTTTETRTINVPIGMRCP
jgi:hypothetical protein